MTTSSAISEADRRVGAWDRYVRFIRVAALAPAFGIPALALIVAPLGDHDRLISWLIPALLGLLLYGLCPIEYLRARRAGRDTRLIRACMLIAAALHGLTWATSVLILPSGPRASEILLATTGFAVATGCFSVLFTAHVTPAFYAYQVPHNLVLTIGLWNHAPDGMGVFALSGFMLLVVSSGLHAHAHRVVISEMEQRHLAEQARMRLRLANEELSHRADHDPLTGLMNRAALGDRLLDLLAEPDHAGRIALMFIDLDRFKEVNDTHGHAAGDRLLIELAERIRDIVGVRGHAGRFGGDEFVVLARIDAEEEAELLAEELRFGLGRPVDLDTVLVTSTVSIGVALSRAGDTRASLLRRADQAVYAAKRAGRDAIMRESSQEPEPPAASDGSANPIPSPSWV